MSAATMRWIGLALLGIVVAAAVAVAASKLVSQQIGLASQPISAGDALAPAAKQKQHESQPGQANGKNSEAGPVTPQPESTTRSAPPESPTHTEPPQTYTTPESSPPDGRENEGADD